MELQKICIGERHLKMNRITILLIDLFLTQIVISHENQALTIQEAWVDSGFFVWKDSTKTALSITAWGASQEFLPDVCVTVSNSLMQVSCFRPKFYTKTLKMGDCF